MGGIGEQEDRLDSGEITVHDRHGRLVRDIHLRTDSLDDHGGTDLGAVVDEQADAPAGDPDVAPETGLANRLLDQSDPLRDR